MQCQPLYTFHLFNFWDLPFGMRNDLSQHHIFYSFVHHIFKFAFMGKFLQLYRFVPTTTGCPKKKWDYHLVGCRGHQKWAKDKSWVSFKKFRRFPFQWALKLPNFVKKQLRKTRSNMPPLIEKMTFYGNTLWIHLLPVTSWKYWLIISFW